MKTEQSIVLQKKMILFLSLMIMSFFSIIYLQENKQNMAFANQVQVMEEDIITVERNSEDEVDQVSRLQREISRLENENVIMKKRLKKLLNID